MERHLTFKVWFHQKTHISLLVDFVMCTQLHFVICCISAKHATQRRKSKSGWLRIRIMSPSWAIYLSAECCFSDLTLCKFNLACHSWRGVFETILCDKVCQGLATGQRFSPGTMVFSTNKTDRHDIIEIMLNPTTVHVYTCMITITTPMAPKIV
jgi:hypothetical protein